MNRRIGCPPDSVNLAMSITKIKFRNKAKRRRESNIIQSKLIKRILISRPSIQCFIRVNEKVRENGFLLGCFYFHFDLIPSLLGGTVIFQPLICKLKPVGAKLHITMFQGWLGE